MERMNIMGKIGYENSVENIQENSGNILKGIQQENIDMLPIFLSINEVPRCGSGSCT